MKESLESLEETGQNPPNRGPQEGLQEGLWEAYFRAYSGGLLSRSGAIYTLSYVQMAQGPSGPCSGGASEWAYLGPVLGPILEGF